MKYFADCANFRPRPSSSSSNGMAPTRDDDEDDIAYFWLRLQPRGVLPNLFLRAATAFSNLWLSTAVGQIRFGGVNAER
jgi:hypothetical protein